MAWQSVQFKQQRDSIETFGGEKNWHSFWSKGIYNFTNKLIRCVEINEQKNQGSVANCQKTYTPTIQIDEEDKLNNNLLKSKLYYGYNSKERFEFVPGENVLVQKREIMGTSTNY